MRAPRFLPSSRDIGAAPVNPADRPFIEGDVVTGRVVEVTQASTLPTPAGKLSAFCGGTPWQLGQHQWYETTVYVEPIGSLDGGTERALLVHGNVSGVRPGHIVEAQVSVRGGALVVRRMVNLTTSSAVRAEGEAVSPVGGCLMLLIAVIVVYGIGCALVAAAESGALAAGVTAVVGSLLVALVNVFGALFAALGPAIVLIIGIALVLRALFR